MNESLKNKNVIVLSDTIAKSAKDTLTGLGVRVLFLGDYKAEHPWIVGSISISGMSEQEIVESVEKEGFKPDAICIFSDRNVHLKAVLCQHFGIPFIDVSQVETVVEKNKMREIFIKNSPEITPQFTVADSLQQVDAFIDSHGFPVMLKPASLDRSLLIARADTYDEAHEVFENISNRITSIYLKRKSRIEPRIIIEEYMTGLKYSVEGVVDSTGELYTPETVTDLWFGYDIGINDPLNHLRITPSLQSAENVQELLECARKAVRALNLKSCPIHAEVIMTESGAKIIEIAARLGGFREEMYRTSLGVSLLESDLRMQIFDDARMMVNAEATYTAAIKVYALNEGRFKRIINLDSLKEYAGYMYSKIKYNYGEMVGPSRLGYSEVLYIYLSSKSKEDLLRDSNKIIEEVVAETE